MHFEEIYKGVQHAKGYIKERHISQFAGENLTRVSVSVSMATGWKAIGINIQHSSVAHVIKYVISLAYRVYWFFKIKCKKSFKPQHFILVY